MATVMDKFNFSKQMLRGIQALSDDDNLSPEEKVFCIQTVLKTPMPPEEGRVVVCQVINKHGREENIICVYMDDHYYTNYESSAILSPSLSVIKWRYLDEVFDDSFISSQNVLD